MTSTSNFNKIQRQVDQLKFQVDEFCEDDLPNVGTASPGRQSAYSRAQSMKKEVSQLVVLLNNLNIENEKMPQNKFENKRKTEMLRVSKLKERLNEVIEQLEPDEIEEDYLRKFGRQNTEKRRKSILKSPDNFLVETGPSKSVKIKSRTPSPRKKEFNFDGFNDEELEDEDEEKTDFEDDEVDDDDDSEEENESEEIDEEAYEVLYTVRALSNYNGEEDDLDFKEGDIIEILETSDDGWWTGRDLHGNEGLVPNTLIEIVNTEDVKKRQTKGKPPLDKQRSGKDLWENLKGSGQKLKEKENHQFLKRRKFIKKDKTKLKGIEQFESDRVNQSRDLADSHVCGNEVVKSKDFIRSVGTDHAKNESTLVSVEFTSTYTSVTDVLKAMKAIPQGFRSSTLGKCYQKEQYRSSAFVIPKTNTSNLQYNDLYWDPLNKKLRSQNSLTCRTVTLVSVKFVPPIGAGVEILSRHVYFALWDGEKTLSNIHVVRAVPLERDLSWTFTPKVAKTIPSLYDGEIVARINSDDRRISLLMELNYSYVRTSTGEKSDISCGWASLNLYDESGAPIPNKNHDLVINGGTPFEKGVPLDPTLNVNANQSLMQSLLGSNRQPRIVVKTTAYNKAAKEIYDMLPLTMVTCQKYARFIGFYRQHVATVFCKDDLIEKGTLFDSLLSQFPRAMDYHDLMDALIISWDEKFRTSLSRAQKRDNMHMQSVFLQTFNESILGLLQCAHLPPFLWADEKAEKARFAFILSFLQKKEPLGNLLSAECKYKPLNIARLAFTNDTANANYPQPISRELLSPS